MSILQSHSSFNFSTMAAEEQMQVETHGEDDIDIDFELDDDQHKTTGDDGMTYEEDFERGNFAVNDEEMIEYDEEDMMMGQDHPQGDVELLDEVPEGKDNQNSSTDLELEDSFDHEVTDGPATHVGIGGGDFGIATLFPDTSSPRAVEVSSEAPLSAQEKVIIAQSEISDTSAVDTELEAPAQASPHIEVAPNTRPQEGEETATGIKVEDSVGVQAGDGEAKVVHKPLAELNLAKEVETATPHIVEHEEDPEDDLNENEPEDDLDEREAPAKFKAEDESEGHREDNQQGTQDVLASTSEAPSIAAGHSSSQGYTEQVDTPPEIIVHYQGNQISLFPPLDQDQDHSGTFFVENVLLAEEGLDRLFPEFREVLGDSISNDDELVIRFPELRLEVTEHSLYETTVSVSTLSRYYAHLRRYDGQKDTAPLTLELEARLSFSGRFAKIESALKAHRGLSSLVSIPIDNRQVTSNEDGVTDQRLVAASHAETAAEALPLEPTRVENYSDDGQHNSVQSATESGQGISILEVPFDSEATSKDTPTLRGSDHEDEPPGSGEHEEARPWTEQPQNDTDNIEYADLIDDEDDLDSPDGVHEDAFADELDDIDDGEFILVP
jgi:hypothetical protein